MNKIQFPNYDESILSITTSVLKNYNYNSDYKSLPELDAALAKNYKNVVLMIFDGMGVSVLKKHLNENDFLRKHTKKDISSVCPCTTTAATSTFYSGLPPICHGWLGWSPYFKEHNAVIELFRNNEYYTQKPAMVSPVADMIKYEHIFNKIKKSTNGQVKTTEVFPPFRENGVKNLDEMCERIINICSKPEKQFVLTYWTEPDSTSHKLGPHAPKVKSLVLDINDKIQELTEQLEDTIIIISADHSHIDSGKFIFLTEHPKFLECLDKPLSLDDRCYAFFVKKEMENDFISYFEKNFSEQFILMSSNEALECNLFGKGVPHKKALDFIGDYIVLAKGEYALRQSPSSPDTDIKGSHSGITKDEMIVPLIIVEKL